MIFDTIGCNFGKNNQFLLHYLGQYCLEYLDNTKKENLIQIRNPCFYVVRHQGATASCLHSFVVST